MADPAQLPDARRAQALATIKQREDGIRAAATKAGYAKRDAEWCAKLGVESVEQALQINQLRAERDARPTLDQYHRHGIARLFQGVAVGALLFTAIISGVWAMSASVSFQNASDYGSRMVVSGAAVQAGAPPQTCIPGERLADGRRCPASETGPRQDVVQFPGSQP